MRRGKITSGSASTARQRQRRAPRPADAAPAAASTSGSRATAQVRQPGRREAGRMQHEAGVDLAALQRLQLHVAGGLDQLQRHLGCCGAEGPHPGRQQARSRRSRRRPAAARPTSPCGRRARLGRQRLRARQQLAHLGQQRRAGRRELHAALGAVEQAHAQQALQLRDGLRQRRLRHVQARGGAAEVQRPRRRPRTGATARSSIDGFVHMPQHINRSVKNGLEAINERSAYLRAFRDTDHETSHGHQTDPDQPPQRQHHRRQVARAQPLDVLRHGLQGERLQEADGRRRQRPQHHHALQHAACRSWPTPPSRASRKPAATRRSSARRPSPTAWRWAPRA